MNRKVQPKFTNMCNTRLYYICIRASSLIWLDFYAHRGQVTESDGSGDGEGVWVEEESTSIYLLKTRMCEFISCVFRPTISNY